MHFGGGAVCDFVCVCSIVLVCVCVFELEGSCVTAPRGQSQKQAKCSKVGQPPANCTAQQTSLRTPQSRHKVVLVTIRIWRANNKWISLSASTHTAFIKKWVILTRITNPIQNTQRVDTVGFSMCGNTHKRVYEGETKIQHCKRLWLLPSFESALKLNKAIYRSGFGAALRIM